VHFHGTWDMYWSDGRPTAMFARHLDRLAASGVSVLRVDIGWSASQPTPAPPSAASWYNRRIATVLRAAAARRLQVLLVLHQSPAWSRPGTGTSVRQFPSDAAAIRPWATWLGRTYGRQVIGFEVWNEPNLQAFTGVEDPVERPRRYVELLEQASAGLRAGDPRAVVVFGGTSQVDTDFVHSAYLAGAKPHFDVMAVHPYQADQTVPPDEGGGGAGQLTRFPELVQVMTEHGDGAKPVWWTEFGFSVHENAPATRTEDRGVPSAAVAADYLRRSFELARTRYPQVRLAVVYTAYRPGADTTDHRAGYALTGSATGASPQLSMVGNYVREYPAARPLR
jgi:hypothetical protein